MRAKRVGYKVIFSPKTVIIHYTSATAKKQDWMLKVFYKNNVRFQLINYPIPWIIGVTFFNLISALFERKRKEMKLGATNLKFRKDGALRLAYLVRGYLTNIKNLSDILQKRKDRTARVVS
jgi:GT2 family glycosyltransferase